MQIEVNENGYVTSYAIVGSVVNGIEVEAPADPVHFMSHYAAYRFADNKLTFDEDKDSSNRQEEQKSEYRALRERECFSVINRGQLWYETLTLSQLVELRKWYKAWLNITDTMTVPERPAWLD